MSDLPLDSLRKLVESNVIATFPLTCVTGHTDGAVDFGFGILTVHLDERQDARLTWTGPTPILEGMGAASVLYPTVSAAVAEAVRLAGWATPDAVELFDQDVEADPDEVGPFDDDPMLHWSTVHEVAAESEGWCIMHCVDSGHGPLQVQCIDGGPLAGDTAAWVLVAEGDEPHHLAARALLARWNGAELRRVLGRSES